MKLKTIFLLLLLIILAACSPAGGGNEPAASDEPTGEATPIVEVEVTRVAPEKIIEGEATAESVGIVILESFPVQVHVNVSGYLGDGCTTLGEITTTQEGSTFFLKIITHRPMGAICTQQLVGFEETVALDVEGLPAGTYTVDVNGVTNTFTLDIDNVPQLPGTDENPSSELGLPDEDVAELLRLTLERALVAQEIPDYTLLADQPEIVLSTENIDPTLLPELDDVALVTMTPEEIQAKADAEGDFPYLRFQGFTAVSTDKVQVSLGSSWARAVDSEIIYLSGGGFTIEYEKTAAGWHGEVIEAWIS